MKVVYQRWHWGESYVLCHLHSPIQVNSIIIIPNIIIIIIPSSMRIPHTIPIHLNSIIIIIIIIILIEVGVFNM